MKGKSTHNTAIIIHVIISFNFENRNMIAFQIYNVLNTFKILIDVSYFKTYEFRSAPLRYRYLFPLFLEFLTLLIVVVLPIYDIYSW